MNQTQDNDHPYHVRFKDLSNRNAMAYWGISDSGLARSYLKFGDIYSYNRGHRKEGPGYLWLDQLIIQWPEADFLRNWEAMKMGGIRAMLESLPASEPIISQTVWSLLISYFGNSAKKKLKSLGTSGAILDWLKTSPMEVLEVLGINLSSITRTEEQRVAAEEAAKPKEIPAPETTAPKKARKTEEPSGITAFLAAATT